MFEASTAMGVASLCTTCGKLPTAERYVLPDGKSLRVYCSRACLRGGVRSRRLKVLGAWARGLRRISVALILVGAWLAPRDGLWRRRAPVASDVEAPAPAQSSPPELPPGWFGPEWPPTETSVLAVLGRDAWVHPLAGPV